MLRLEEMIQIKVMHQQGNSIRAIARILNISRNTVKRYLASDIDIPHYNARPEMPSKLDKYRNYLVKRQQSAYPDWIPATVLFREIIEQEYKGSLSLLRQFLYEFKQSNQKEDNIIRFETPPGKKMKIDWAEFNRGKDRLCALIATLGFSRMSYVEFVDNEKIDTLLKCLINAFEYFGGLTEHLLFDNMKTVVLRRDAYGQGIHRFHNKLWDFAKHYGFIPKLCAPYRAQTKGKVERFIGYLRHSFYVPLRSSLAQANMVIDTNTANIAVNHWLNHVANKRLHATLQQRPIDLFALEKPHLSTLAPSAYRVLLNPPEAKHELLIINKLPKFTDQPLQHNLSIYQQILNQQIAGEHYEFTA